MALGVKGKGVVLGLARSMLPVQPGAPPCSALGAAHRKCTTLGE